MSRKKDEKDVSEKDIMITEEVGLNVIEMIKKLKEIMPLIKEYSTLTHQYNVMLHMRYEFVEKSEDDYQASIFLDEKIPFRMFSHDHFKCVATDKKISRVTIGTDGMICLHYYGEPYSSEHRCYDLRGIFLTNLIELECNLREILPKIENDLRTWINKYGQFVETLKKIVATLEMIFK